MSEIVPAGRGELARADTLEAFGRFLRLNCEKRRMTNMSLALAEAEHRLRILSPERLRVADDFLAYLQEREENEATAELLNIPGFEAAFRRAVEQADGGEIVRFEDIRRDV